MDALPIQSKMSSSNSHVGEIKKVALIGSGAMGGGLALLLAENGCDVSLQDPHVPAMEKVMAAAKEQGVAGKVEAHHDYKTLCASLDSPKVFLWSLPHGMVGDHVLDGLMPYLQKGDIMIDCANEHWNNTHRRQGKCHAKGIRYVGCGVSGGYQAARRGPSMCPGSDDETMEVVLPLLRKIAAKAPGDGSPCVAKIGTGGGGHYCKMIHNGIEHGMMSAIAEAWGIMTHGLGMDQDEVGDVLHSWNASGELKGTFLVRIGAEICQTKNADGFRVLDEVGDKVVQDTCGEEGTGIWSNTEAIEQHVPAPTLTAAHYLRVASADLAQRRMIQKVFATSYPPQKLSVTDKAAFLEDLRYATYVACLASFCQGLNVIDKADQEKHFNVDYYALLQIWRAGCIIQADHISTELLQPLYKDTSKPKNPLFEPSVAAELKRGFAPLKRVVLAATEGDHTIPALAATLDYLKYQTNTDNITSFSEAQLDYFGRHMYDKKGDADPEGLPTLGKYHYEWKPA